MRLSLSKQVFSHFGPSTTQTLWLRIEPVASHLVMQCNGLKGRSATRRLLQEKFLKKTREAPITVSQSSCQKMDSTYIPCWTAVDHCVVKYHKADALTKQKLMPLPQQNLVSHSFLNLRCSISPLHVQPLYKVCFQNIPWQIQQFD